MVQVLVRADIAVLFELGGWVSVAESLSFAAGGAIAAWASRAIAQLPTLPLRPRSTPLEPVLAGTHRVEISSEKCGGKGQRGASSRTNLCR